MEPGSASRPRVPGRAGTGPGSVGVVRGQWRRRPAGEPPPLPRRLGTTGWWWLGVGILYALIPQGRTRQVGKKVVVGIITVLAVARMYLAVDTPTGVLVASIIGVTIPLVAFRLFCPDEVFPVTYRRGRSAHLDVGR